MPGSFVFDPSVLTLFGERQKYLVQQSGKLSDGTISNEKISFSDTQHFFGILLFPKNGVVFLR